MEKMARKLLMKGIFAVDKPANVYTMRILEKIKEVLTTQLPASRRPTELKIGHGGILDYSASGVLGTCHGCKKLSKYLQGDKGYMVVGKFGEETDTYNDTGKVTSTMNFDHITKDLIDLKLKTKFTGRIMQTPPKFSALKKDGRRISDLVMEGQDVEMVPREVRCYRVSCSSYQPPFFQLEVKCGGGFYVRSLVHDLGKELGSCAHVTDLRRTRQGPFDIADALTETEWTAHNIIKAIDTAKNLRQAQEISDEV